MDQLKIMQMCYEMSDDDFDSTSSDSDEVLPDSSDSSMEMDVMFKRRKTLHRTPVFVENVVPSYDDDEFKRHFRLNRSTCNQLIEQIAQSNILPCHKFGREKINPEKAVLLTIWYLTNTETFRQIGDRFNITDSSACRIIRRVVKYFVKISPNYIKYPENKERDVVREEFRKMQGIDGVVGAIDGCHINIKKPVKDAHVYCNRKSMYTILLQGVCDHNKRFIDVFCGEAGSIHDARLLKRSSIYEKGMTGYFVNDFLLGDSAYPCLPWLIPPFRDNGQLTRDHKTFNYRHSACRILIENAFGLLKGRFRRLKFFENQDIFFIVECVISACVLHNICIDSCDEVECEVENDENDVDEHSICNTNELIPGHSKRDKIFNTMFNI